MSQEGQNSVTSGQAAGSNQDENNNLLSCLQSFLQCLHSGDTSSHHFKDSKDKLVTAAQEKQQSSNNSFLTQSLDTLLQLLGLMNNPDAVAHASSGSNGAKFNKISADISSTVKSESKPREVTTVSENVPKSFDDMAQKTYNELAKDKNGDYKEGYCPPYKDNQGRTVMEYPSKEAKQEHYQKMSQDNQHSLKTYNEAREVEGYSNQQNEYVELDKPKSEKEFQAEHGDQVKQPEQPKKDELDIERDGPGLN